MGQDGLVVGLGLEARFVIQTKPRISAQKARQVPTAVNAWMRFVAAMQPPAMRCGSLVTDLHRSCPGRHFTGVFWPIRTQPQFSSSVWIRANTPIISTFDCITDFG
jgi:hypothetical protein